MGAASCNDTMIAFASYEPVHSDEIGLNVGDIVSLFQCYDDGWAFAINQITKNIGFVPSNFLQPYRHSSDRDLCVEREASDPPNRITSMHIAEPDSFLEKSHPKGAMPGYNSVVMAGTPFHASNNDMNLRIRDDASETRFKQSRKVARIPTSSEAQNRLKEVEISRKLRARPATSFGKFKIHITGDSGIGKTTLAKQMLNFGEVLTVGEPTLIPAKKDQDIHVPMIEYKASTLHPASVYPEEDRYNINIIDTPGYSACIDANDIINSVVDYAESQFRMTAALFSEGISSTQLFRFLSGSNGAHSHIDVCIYCLLHRATESDIEYMKSMSEFVTVIPLFVKGDTMTKDEAFAAKKDLIKRLDEENISFFGFGLTPEEMIVLADSKVEGVPPLVVSSRIEMYKSGIKYARVNDIDNRYPRNDLCQSSESPNGSPQPYPGLSRRLSSSAQVGELEMDTTPLPSDYRPRNDCLNELKMLRLALMHYHADDIRRSTSLKYLFWKKKKY